MIRYNGGTGGETFSWMLDELLNHGAKSDQTIENRRDYRDIFDSALHRSVVSTKFFSNEVGRTWTQIPIETLKKKFDNIVLQSSKPNIIAKGHLSSMPLRYWSKVFTDWYMIDLISAVKRFWVSQFLVFYKVSFVKYPHDIKRFSDYPHYTEVRNFFDQHGWIPGFWVQIMNKPNYESIYDIDHYFKISTKGVSNIRDYQWYHWPCNLKINGTKLAVDQTLEEFHKTFDALDISRNNRLIPEIQKWVRANREIFDRFGLLDKIDNNYEMEDEESYLVLRDLFWDKAVKLANGDSS